MAYSVYTFASQYADTGMVGVYVGTRAENLGECLSIIARELELIGSGDIRPDELERAKENLKGRIMLSMESTSNRASRLGKSVLTDAELLSLDRICAEIDAVEPEAVAALARPALQSRAAVGRRHRPRRRAVRAGPAPAQPVAVARCLTATAGKLGR